MELSVRPLRPDDRRLVARLFARLSERSRLDRFFVAKPRLSEQELDVLSGVDGREHEALVALEPSGEPAAIARWVRDRQEPRVAEFAIAVADEWQGRRVGTELAAAVRETACAVGVDRFRATMRTGNGRARSLFRRLGDVVSSRLEGSTVEVEVDLRCE
jgi:RimJ/RimL family protein N-acetyltransferase